MAHIVDLGVPRGIGLSHPFDGKNRVLHVVVGGEMLRESCGYGGDCLAGVRGGVTSRSDGLVVGGLGGLPLLMREEPGGDIAEDIEKDAQHD